MEYSASALIGSSPWDERETASPFSRCRHSSLTK